LPYEWEYRGFNLWRRTGKGGGRYYAIWLDENGRPQKKSLRTAEAEAAKDRLYSLALRRRSPQAEPAASLTVRELVTRHYETHARKLASGEQAYHHAKLLNERLGHLTLKQLTVREQERFVAWMRETGRSSGYTARVMSDLRHAVRLAVENEELADPIRIIKVKPVRNRVAPVLPLAALANLWKAAEGSFHGSMYLVLALGTGARPAAILDLTRDQAREDLETVELLPKGKEQNHKRRPIVPLTEPVRLWARLVPEGHLVHLDGHPLQSIRSTFKRLRERAGLAADVTPYSLRRSVATHLFRRYGVPKDDIACLLGHRTGHDTTDLYIEIGDFLPTVRRGLERFLDEIGRVGARPILPTVAEPPRQRRCL
jgi:integrase